MTNKMTGITETMSMMMAWVVVFHMEEVMNEDTWRLRCLHLVLWPLLAGITQQELLLRNLLSAEDHPTNSSRKIRTTIPVHLPTMVVALQTHCPRWTPFVKTFPMSEVAAIN
jgi:hypothetical protein